MQDILKVPQNLSFSGHDTFHCRHLWLKKGFEFVKAGYDWGILLTLQGASQYHKQRRSFSLQSFAHFSQKNFSFYT